MPTLIVKDKSSEAQQFLAFARTLPYVHIVEDASAKNESALKASVADTLRKTERGEELVVCENAEDMFNRLGI
ncbi:MAG: hypothetical protein LBT78_03980 [Tannerella sp.]|jgi:hypothetical protein|nr:hypothetical protein [Tannerella sp.]